MIRHISSAVGFSVLMAFGLVAAPQEPTDTTLEQRQLAKKMAFAVEFFELLQGESSEPLDRELVLRWGNLLRGAGDYDHGRTVLYSYKGRPEAMANLNPWAGRIHHEFTSFSRSLDLKTTRNEVGESWQPKGHARFAPVAEAETPAASERLRLVQAKKLARDFSVRLTGFQANNRDQQELRMLPTPLKVYKSDDSTSNVKSGAMFTFVLGTDPECMLLLEAVEFKGRLRWEYAFGRATRGGLIGRYKGNEVWRAEKGARNESDALAYTLTSPEADVSDVK